VRSCICREDSAATRSAPSSGRSSPTSTVLIPRAPTTETPTSSSSASTCTTMRQQADATCPARCSWTSSPVPWTPCAQGPTARSSAPTTLCSARPALATTGPKATTPRARSSLIRCSTSCARRLSHATASKAFSSLTRWAAARAQAWALCSSPRSARSTLTESC
jgi:hypothetical protein